MSHHTIRITTASTGQWTEQKNHPLLQREAFPPLRLELAKAWAAHDKVTATHEVSNFSGLAQLASIVLGQSNRRKGYRASRPQAKPQVPFVTDCCLKISS